MKRVLPGIRDRKLKHRFSGKVLLFGGPGSPELIALVYGQTLEEMRERKHAVTSALDALCRTRK